MAEQYQLLTTSHPYKHDRDDSSSIHPLRPTKNGVGKPEKQTALNLLDCVALAIVLLCAAAAILVVIPTLTIAASLQFENQIIIVGLLLSLMQICQQRIVQRLLLALEARSRVSTIHNFDGLLRWSFLTPHFAWTWRGALLVLMAVPLALSVLYKRFIGGSASMSYNVDLGVFQPGSLPGVPIAGSLAVFANKTNALIIASADDSSAPTNSQYPKAYGPSMLLINDGTAVAFDEPRNILKMQRSLPPRSTLFFSADVRGTVSIYNDSIDSHRSDEAFWYSFPGQPDNHLINGYASCQFGLQIQSGLGSQSSTNSSDVSYALLGGYPMSVNGSIPNMPDTFFSAALLFNTLRYDCHGEWQLTPSSFRLSNGSCSPQPLPLALQYTKNAHLDMSQVFVDAMGEILGPYGPCGARNGSAWSKPSTAGLLAIAYSARLATVPVGPLYPGSNYTPPIPYNLTKQQVISGELPRRNQTWTVYDQSYEPTNIQMHLEVPTLKASWGLYAVILVQPFITITAFLFLVTLLYNTPISAGFGLVSILAGVDTESVDILKGASFSGQLSKKVGMAIHVVEDTDADEGQRNSIKYTIGETRSRGRIRGGLTYN